MKYLHIVPGANDVANGMARVARLLAVEQGDAQVVDLAVVSDQWLAVGSQRLAVSGQSLAVSEGSESLGFVESLEEVWVHGMWLPKEWAICRRVLRAGKRLVRMTHGSLSPVYLKQQGRWKKWLVGPIERSILRRCERIVATCDAEKAWIEAYLGKKCPEIVMEDVKRFFDFSRKERIGRVETCRGEGCFGRVEGEKGESSEVRVQSWRKENSKLQTSNSKLNLLYLGRRHPLKGLEYLEQAVKELVVRSQGLGVRDVENNSKLELQNLELKIVSNAFGEELEKVWAWCDVLVLPTLSENFGLVVAEALERGKRVITTDGAPVWGEGLGVRSQEAGVSIGYGGRLLYLKGYRDGSDEERVGLLKKAILFLAAKGTKDA